MKLVLGAFLVAHALVHASYLAPAPPRTAGGQERPFEMTRSWLVTGAGLDPALVRMIGTALVLTTIALLVAAGLWTVGGSFRRGGGRFSSLAARSHRP